MTIGARKRSAGRFTHRDRRIIFLMSVVAFVLGYGASQMAQTLTFARASLGLSEADMSVVFAITRAASLLGLAFMIVADRRGRRLPFLIAFAMMPLGNLGTAVLPGPLAFTITQSVTRIGIIGTGALGIVILAEELSPAIRALGMGLNALAAAVGTGLGLVLLPIAERSDGSYRILYALTAIGLLVLPLLKRFLKESRAYVQYEKGVTFRRALAAGLGRHFWPLAGVAFFVTAFSSPAFDFVLERLIDDLKWNTGPATWLLIFFSGPGNAIGYLFGGRMADTAGRKPTSVTAMILGVIGGIGFYTVSSGWLLAPTIFLASLGAGMLAPALAAHRTELFPTRIRATAQGWYANAAIVGSIGGFLLGGILIDRVGLSAAISSLGIGVVFAILLLLKLPETKGIDLLPGRAARSGATRPGQRP